MNQDRAIEAWKQTLGDERVLCDRTTRQAAETATFATEQKIPAILQPNSREEIQECLRIANRWGIPLYPVSSGKNWGYGSRVPAQDGCVLLDLSSMNRIVEFNEELAYVTLEPGVTQRQLYEFLQARSSRLWMDATGSSADTSLIGNVMERGFGHTPYGDRFANVCGLEVVLPDGECLHTGFGRFANAKAAPLYRWGLGPYLDGLFSQSNLGIVTQMTLWLMPAPEYFQAFYFSIERDEQLSELIDALRPLRQNGTIRSAVHIGNNYKVLSSIRQYPWQEAGNATPLPSEVMADFAKTWDFGAWNGSGGIYGSKQQVAAARLLIKTALKGKVSKLRFLDDFTIRLAQKFAKPYQQLTGLNLPELLKLLKPVYGLMKGIPTETQIAGTYWRKKSPPPEQPNPDRDRCGLLWCAPVAPLDGQHATKIHQLASTILTEGGFEPSISITLLTERCLGCVITIAYDRDVPEEDRKAMMAYERLQQALNEAGYYPYRTGIQSMATYASQSEESYQTAIALLKQALDPNNILAPGRYNVNRDREEADLTISFSEKVK
jgi:4-cresol dehydrogenase (hydroxylating) flavoprotein subunit